MSDTLPDIVILIVPKFPLGHLVATPNAVSKLTVEEMSSALNRHCAGDWGKLDEEDEKANDHALEHGGRLFSAYESDSKIRFWIITEADRSVTTILLPEDY